MCSSARSDVLPRPTRTGDSVGTRLTHRLYTVSVTGAVTRVTVVRHGRRVLGPILRAASERRQHLAPEQVERARQVVDRPEVEADVGDADPAQPFDRAAAVLWRARDREALDQVVGEAEPLGQPVVRSLPA